MRAGDIGERRRRRADFRARQVAEPVEGGEAEKRHYAPLRRAALAEVAAERRQRHAPLGGEAAERVRRAEGLGCDDLGWLDPADLAREVRLARLAQHEGACRDVDGGETVEPVVVGLARPCNGEQAIGAGRIEEAFLRHGAGRHEPDDGARDDRFAAALACRGGILRLLADGDAMAGGDEAVEIFLGAVDGHATHGDVLAGVLAASRQHDAERGGRNFRIGEEQFVEIAHPGRTAGNRDVRP